MSDVKRYEFRKDALADCYCDMEETDRGGYVTEEDYESLRSRLVIESKAREGREALLRENESLRSRLAACELERDTARELLKEKKARLADAEALLRELRGDYARAMNDAQIAAAVGCNSIELGVKLSALLGKIARIDAHLSRKEGET